MKREDLKAKGLTDEQIDYVMAENGKEITAEQNKTSEANKKLTTANDTIKKLQETVKKFDGVDVDALKTQITDLQTKYDTDLTKVKLDNALELALINNKAKNTKAVKALLDDSLIKLDGDKLLGLEEQLNNLKKEQSFLFDEEKIDKDGDKKPESNLKVNSGGQHGGAAEPDYDNMSDEEYYKTVLNKK